jgi:hypothetical protein
MDWAQLNRFHLKTETESILRKVLFLNVNMTVSLDKDRTMDDVQKHNTVLTYHRHKLLDVINTV